MHLIGLSDQFFTNYANSLITEIYPNKIYDLKNIYNQIMYYKLNELIWYQPT